MAHQGWSGDGRRPNSVERYQCSLRVPSTGTIVLELLGYLALFLTISQDMSFVAAFMPATTWLCVLLFIAGALEVLAWKAAGRFDEPGRVWLEWSVVFRIVMLPAIVVLAIVWPEGETSVLVIGSTALLVSACRVGLFVVRLLGQRAAVRRARKRRLARAERLAEGIEVTERFMPRAAEPSWLEVATRRLIGALLVLLSCLAIATTVEAVETGHWRVPASTSAGSPAAGKSGKKKAAGRSRTKDTKRSQKAATNSDASGEVPVEQAPERSPDCPPIEMTSGVPPAMTEKIEELFRLAGSSGTTGCPRKVSVRRTAVGALYWSLAWIPGDPHATAIAVAAPGETPFVALAPTVTPIERLLLAGRLLSAEREFARYYAGMGYVYVIQSEIGSTLLTKEDLQASRPLVVSPPSVATAIRSTDKQLGRWLWPSEPRQLSWDDTEYDLKASLEGPILERVHYNPVDHTAWRGARQHPLRYTAHEQALLVRELRTWLPTPPKDELQLEHEIELDER